jgi:hypothetical protein
LAWKEEKPFILEARCPAALTQVSGGPDRG